MEMSNMHKAQHCKIKVREAKKKLRQAERNLRVARRKQKAEVSITREITSLEEE